MQANQYLGIKKLVTSQISVHGSKFYGFLFPAQAPEDFSDALKFYKSTYADSTHVCSACVLRPDRSYQRFNDDGEPGNSAGRPILNAILSARITNVVCVVIRYYGGKKLGISGLIRAYSLAAKSCINSSDIISITEKNRIICSTEIENQYHLYNFMNNHKDISYVLNNDGLFILSVPKSKHQQIIDNLLKMDILVYE